MRNRETKDFSLQIKEVDEQTGTFTGYLSVYDVVDAGNDLTYTINWSISSGRPFAVAAWRARSCLSGLPASANAHSP